MTTPAPSRRREVAPPARGAATPPAKRDRSLWLTALAILPLFLRAWGAQLGEPFADDYDFLHHAMLGGASLLDGGGAVIYWRPLSRQLYYALLGPVMLSLPLAVAVFHAALLWLAAALVWRTLRPAWSGPWAAAAATFPLLAESVRTFLLWPSSFQDLGALLFSALALHEASRRRLATALGALLAAMLCKEIAVIAVLMLPWMPGIRNEERRPWLLGTGALLLVWGAAYVLVMRSGSVAFPREVMEARPPLPARLAWAITRSFGDAVSSNVRAGQIGMTVESGVALLLAAAAIAGRRRLARELPWMAWGTAWFALGVATLSETHPPWGGFRSVVPHVGLGIACVALLRVAGPRWFAALVAVRLAAFFTAPTPPAGIPAAAVGAGLDFDELARLQRYAVEVRRALTARYPTLPLGARVGRLQRPRMADHALAIDRAPQVWYRDSTLRQVEWKELLGRGAPRLSAAYEYEPLEARQIALIEPASVARFHDAMEAAELKDWAGALVLLHSADSLQADRGARVYLGSLAGKRAICRLRAEDYAGARDDALEGMRLWRGGEDARYVIAALLALEDRLGPALAEVDSILAINPAHALALDLREMILGLRR